MLGTTIKLSMLSVVVTTCTLEKTLLIDLIRETISHYVIHLRMAKAHECPLGVTIFTHVEVRKL